jgi:hypothetical protein
MAATPSIDMSGWLDSLLERRRRAEATFVSVVATSCLLGVSTRRMEKLVETLGITRLSKSQVSVMAKDLDDQVEAFRTPFETVVRDRSKNHLVTAPASAGARSPVLVVHHSA